MQFKSVFFAFSILAAAAFALVQAAKREKGYVHGCTKINLEGDCGILATDFGVIDEGIFCNLYTDYNCSGPSITADDADTYAETLPVGWTNTISSMQCFPRNT